MCQPEPTTRAVAQVGRYGVGMMAPLCMKGLARQRLSLVGYLGAPVNTVV